MADRTVPEYRPHSHGLMGTALGTRFPGHVYPKGMHHADKDPVVVHSPEEEKEAIAQGFTHQHPAAKEEAKK